MIGSLNIGGAQVMIMDLYRRIDRKQIQFDFVVDHVSQLYFGDEVKRLGGQIYFLPNFSGYNIATVIKSWNTFFDVHPEYKILHSHVRSYASIYIPIAKKHGVTTIIHSHSTSNGKGLSAMIKKILQYPLRYQADYFMGCSRSAGKWLFGDKVASSKRFFVLPNAIDVSKYCYNAATRNEVRKELNIGNEIVYGHVGRFHEAKNHLFLLEVFACIKKIQPGSKLVLVGDGQLKNVIKYRIATLGIADSVIMTGERSDVFRLLQAFDCFLFPSKWEGLPVTVVEAQAAGVPCFLSDSITSEVNLSNLVHCLQLNKGATAWANEICKCSLSRQDVENSIIRAGFDINKTTKWINDFYMRLANE